MSTRISGFVLAPLVLLGGCALQPSYQRPALNVPGAWTNLADSQSSSPTAAEGAWWSQLGDPAIDQLVEAGLSDNPTLAEAAARVDQARALLTVRDAGKVPAVGIEGSITRSRGRVDPTGGSTSQTAGALGVRLSWELDLWGRVRESSNAARHRLTARDADAEGARLSVIGDIADTTIALRTCRLTLAIRDRDIASRETELKISRARLTFGNIAAVQVATAQSNLAAARTARIVQDEMCRRLVDALVALSGLQANAVRDLTLPASYGSVAIAANQGAGALKLPEPPRYAPALPTTVLLGNPGVVAAEREVAARWSEIAVARAERMPRIDLSALLTGQWISTLGSDSSFISRSAGATLSGPLFDGGAGKANVRMAQAAYREAVAQLSFTLRSAVRDIEDSLAAQQSAAQRIETSSEALQAASFTLNANEARWRAGAIAQFELEESRRQFNQAQESAVTATADRARAWVALMRRTGAVTGNGAAKAGTADDKETAPALANGNKRG